MSPSELVQLSKQLIDAARARGLTLRLFGGVAISAHCDSIANHPTLQREFADIDFVAPRGEWDALEPIFTAHGFTLKDKTANEWHFTREGITAELNDAHFRENGRAWDFDTRLKLDPYTASLADLLLLKLQRQPFADKDRRDAIALLLDHRVAKEDDEETISHMYIADVTSKNFPFWDVVMDNTIELEKILDKYIEPEEAQLVWRRIELIQGEMDRHPKALAWWSRAIFSRKLPWYH